MSLAKPGERLKVLCLGCHSDDIEIGAGATLLGWIAGGARVHVTWGVLSGCEKRSLEACASARSLLEGADHVDIRTADFTDGGFPQETRAIKAWMEKLKAEIETPDVILTHWSEDAHQDHRTVAEITGTTFRDHLMLAYEIPKWDGDMGRPCLYVPATAAHLERKIAVLLEHFASQRNRDWFDADTFRGLARLRGMECRAKERFAEAFYVRKLVLG